MAHNWEAGDLIMRRYRLISLLGQGGMGSVWRAEHIELKNQVAVKLLDPAISQNEEMIGRFLREARAAASLQNRHVIQIFDHGVEDGEAFMVMELLEGESLGERLQRGPLSVDDTIKFMCQVMRAMAKAHDAGIIHRDLKPDNIFITSDDDGEYAKVLDFGVAKVGGDLGVTNGVKTQTGMMLGTPFYMSPEQAKAKKVDARTDVWALAVITYECLTGKRPFTGDSFADLVLTLCNAPIPIPSQTASVPIGFDEWFVHATQRDVDRRFRSARDMASELLQLANSPMTGKMGTGASAYGGARMAPVRTPARGTPGGARMSMTTGQRAAVGIDSRTPPPLHSQKGGGNGVWVVASVAMLLLTAGAGAYAWQIAGQNSSAAAMSEEAAADQRPKTSAAAQPDAADESQKAEEPPEPTAQVAEAAEAEPSTEKPVEPPSVEKAPEKKAEKASPPAAPTHPPPTPSKTEEKKTPPAETQPSSGNSVPVVDNEALPPTEWEF